MGPATHHANIYIIYVHMNILMSIRQRVTLNIIPFYLVVLILLMLTSYAKEFLYIMHEIRVIIENQDNNKNWKISKTSISFTRSGGILNLPLHEILLNLDTSSLNPLHILYLDGNISCRNPHNYIKLQILVVP